MKNKNINKTIGILGGGQLGRMLYESITPWNINIHFLDKDSSFPAGKICPQFIEGDFNNYDDVVTFAKGKDVIGIEIENVNTEALKVLEKSGISCFPQPNILNTIKDKGLQKQFYKTNNFPSSEFQLLEGKDEIINYLKDRKISFPFVQKARKEGYDGRAVQLIRTEDDLDKLMDVPSVIEDLVDIEKELSVIVARNELGQIEVFPTVEMVVNPKANQLDYQLCPADISNDDNQEMNNISKRLVEKWNLVGLLAIEFFISKEGEILINEVAPRPHNSGHHTIEACNVSQFEQLGRALLGISLIKPKLVHPSVMINLVGSEGYTGKATYVGMEECLEDDNIFVHLYGKDITKPYRKMGHITIIDENIENAIKKAKFVKNLVKVIC